MAEVTFHARARAEAHPEQAWAVVCDTTHYAAWVTGTEAVTHTDGPARLGPDAKRCTLSSPRCLSTAGYRLAALE